MPYNGNKGAEGGILVATVFDWLVQLSDFIEHHIGAITAVIAGAAVFQWRLETRLTAERQLRAYILNYSASLFDGSDYAQCLR